jgi:CDP-diacylglycerol--glycerol-3-phosphate 3-phosphatidyltransferase
MSHLPTAGSALWRLPLVDLVPLLGLPAIWVAACIFFCVRAAIFGMPRTARIDKLAKSPYLPRIIMEFGYWMFTLPIAICLALGITPDLLTLGSLVVTVAGSVMIGMGHFGLGGWILFFAFMLDAWDGIVARKLNISSVGGEFLDATIDRYNDLLGFLGLMFYYRNDPLPLALATLSLIGSTLVSYTRAKGEAVGVDPNVGYMQRHERAVYLGISLVIAPLISAFVEPDAAHPRYHLVVLVLGLMAVTTNVTAIWRARFVLDGLRRRGLARPAAAPSAPPIVAERHEPIGPEVSL